MQKGTLINEVQKKIIRGKHNPKKEHLGKPIITIIGFFSDRIVTNG